MFTLGVHTSEVFHNTFCKKRDQENLHYICFHKLKAFTYGDWIYSKHDADYKEILLLLSSLSLPFFSMSEMALRQSMYVDLHVLSPQGTG